MARLDSPWQSTVKAFWTLVGYAFFWLLVAFVFLTLIAGVRWAWGLL